MKLEYVPLIRTARQLYNLPWGRERFVEYLRTMRNDDASGLSLPPFVIMNPMAREHVPALLDQLLTIDADAIAARAVADAAGDQAGMPGDYKIGLVVADDLKGGWTNRYAAEFNVRFQSARMSKPSWSVDCWLSGVLWSSEAVSETSVREAVLTTIYRTAYVTRHGQARTLAERLAQEGWVMARSGCTGPSLDDEEVAYTREVLAPFLDATDMRTTVECLFGDVAAQSLGFTSRGLSTRAGLAVALHNACAQANQALSSAEEGLR